MASKPSSKPKTGAATAANTPDANANAAAQAPEKERRTVNPDEVIYWNSERDIALLQTLLPANGQLTAKQLTKALSDHAAFAEDRHLLLNDRASEKVRQRVKKLSEMNVAKGRVALELRRSANTSYDPMETLDAVFAQHATPVQPQPQGQSAYPSYPGAGVSTGLAGGLIPTA